MNPTDPLDRIQARQHLDDINHFILRNTGEILVSPGKLSLVWVDEPNQQQRFLAVKAAGEDSILINGRRFPASEHGLRQGLRASLVDMRQADTDGEKEAEEHGG